VPVVGDFIPAMIIAHEQDDIRRGFGVCDGVSPHERKEEKGVSEKGDHWGSKGVG